MKHFEFKENADAEYFCTPNTKETSWYDWGKLGAWKMLYANPPFSKILHTSVKVYIDQATVALVIPEGKKWEEKEKLWGLSLEKLTVTKLLLPDVPLYQLNPKRGFAYLSVEGIPDNRGHSPIRPKVYYAYGPIGHVLLGRLQSPSTPPTPCSSKNHGRNTGYSREVLSRIHPFNSLVDPLYELALQRRSDATLKNLHSMAQLKWLDGNTNANANANKDQDEAFAHSWREECFVAFQQARGRGQGNGNRGGGGRGCGGGGRGEGQGQGQWYW